jgi:hypothetical protein
LRQRLRAVFDEDRRSSQAPGRVDNKKKAPQRPLIWSSEWALQANAVSGNGGLVNEGDVVVTVNGISSGPIAVSNGIASTVLTPSGTSLLNAGNYPNGISAAYMDGATNNYASADATGAVTVTAPTTTTLTTPSISSTYSGTTPQTVTLSASWPAPVARSTKGLSLSQRAART